MAAFFVTLLFVRFFAVSPGVINGPSMERTLVDNDRFLVNRMVYLFRTPRRFEIVQFVEPQNGELVIKRIIGLPGEVLIIRGSKVFVKEADGTEEIELNERGYLTENVFTTAMNLGAEPVFTIPPHSYFVMGDNRAHSGDSRAYGPVDRSQIVGRVSRYSF